MKSYFDMTPLEKLYELRSTLQEVASAENTQLRMETWVTHLPTEHFCNSACCVMGYQAIKEAMKSSQELTIERLRVMATDMADHGNLSRSIWDCLGSERKKAAKATGLFCEKELDSLHYLHTNSPNFNDAIEYLNACIVKMESSHAHR